MITERDLIEQCQRNERRAQQLLFDSYKRKVMGICLRYASDKEAAEDVAQEAFINIFNSLTKKKSSEIQSLSAWISGITINTAINMYYKIRKHNHVDLNDYTGLTSTMGPESILEKLNTQDLLSLIQSMPIGYRLVFNLFIIEGFDHSEIAVRMNISESASRSQLTRAKEWLRNRLSEKKEINVARNSVTFESNDILIYEAALKQKIIGI